MSNYRMKIQYDGTRYKGWQRQRSGADTIQGRIEAVLSRLTGEPAEIDGAGRTDAGVHAWEQVANVHLTEGCEPRWLHQKLNEYLPEDIRIMEVKEVSERFHSRLNATGKIYEYRLLKKGCCDVFRRKYAWNMDDTLDIEKMRLAAEQLKGQHDFKGFCTKASKKKSTVRRIDDIEIVDEGSGITLRFTGNGFLYNMVRILTGTLVEIGTGERSAETIPHILQSGERQCAGQTAPAKGLMLKKVLYD